MPTTGGQITTNNPTLYTLTRDTSLASAGQDPCGSYIVTGVCIHNTENTNNRELLPEEAHYCMVFLSQQHGFGLLT
jgi:hypothetical protein